MLLKYGISVNFILAQAMLGSTIVAWLGAMANEILHRPAHKPSPWLFFLFFFPGTAWLYWLQQGAQTAAKGQTPPGSAGSA